MIQGIGTVKRKIGNNVLTLENVCFITDLGESIYRLFLHIQRPNHSLNSLFTDGFMINLPTFKTKAIVGTLDIYLDAVPLSYDPDTMKSTPSILSSTQDYCHNITDLPKSSSILQNVCGGTCPYYLDHCYF